MARRYGYKGEGAATRGVFSFLSDLVGSDFVARLQPCSSYEDAFRLFSSLPGTWRRRILGDAAVD
jgi:hypothetical protein